MKGGHWKDAGGINDSSTLADVKREFFKLATAKVNKGANKALNDTLRAAEKSLKAIDSQLKQFNMKERREWLDIKGKAEGIIVKMTITKTESSIMSLLRDYGELEPGGDATQIQTSLQMELSTFVGGTIKETEIHASIADEASRIVAL